MLLCTKDTSNISSDIENHLSYAVALNDLCDLQTTVKVTQFECDLYHSLVLLCTKFGEDTSNIYIFVLEFVRPHKIKRYKILE